MDPMEFSMLEEPNEGEEEEEEEAEEEEEEEKKTISKMLKFKWNLVHFLARLHYHQQVRLRNQQCIERNLKRHWNQWFYLVHRLQNQMRRNFLRFPEL
jgi:hypothetical protein